jgi:hypothetical protein
MTDSRGDELSDRRLEAQTIRRLVRERWNAMDLGAVPA